MTGWQISCPTCGARFDVSDLGPLQSCPACGCCACKVCRMSPIVAVRNELARVESLLRTSEGRTARVTAELAEVTQRLQTAQAAQAKKHE